MEFKGPKGILAIVVIVFIVVILLKQNLDRREMRQWSTVDGSVISSYISDARMLEQTSYNDVKIRKDVVEYTLNVSYEYEVDGINYFGDNLGFMPGKKSRSLASIERLMGQFSEGKKVAVYYNPSDPSDSILYR